jgi:3-oxoacyl-[acyl-carrier protein] reductase
MDQEFAGKTVVITGAAGIYGSQLAENFAAAGARLFLTDRDAAGLAAIAARTRAASATADLTDPDSVAALCRAVLGWAVPDVVVNNAGIYPFGGLFDTPVEMLDRIMHVNAGAVSDHPGACRGDDRGGEEGRFHLYRLGRRANAAHQRARLLHLEARP